MEDERRGMALVVSGPSGVGKSTVLHRVLDGGDGWRFSVSCTTRQPRAGEADGQDYYFITREAFAARVEAGEFLEHAEVHGNHYGTLSSEVRDHIEAGTDVLLDIDVQGAQQIRAHCRDDAYWRAAFAFVFIGPPSLSTLEARLRGRGTDSAEVIARRLGNARAEMEQWSLYDYLIINDTLDAAVHHLQAIVDAERLKSSRIRRASPWNDLHT